MSFQDRDHQKRNRNHEKHRKNKEYSSSSSSDSEDKWVEKQGKADREDWMSMTGMIKTYTKDDMRSKVNLKEKKQIDSYNPSKSSRELNPYWKNGGQGLPQTSAEILRSRQFIKPKTEDDYYTPSKKRKYDDDSSKKSSCRSDRHETHRHIEEEKSQGKSSGWRKESKNVSYRSKESNKDDSYQNRNAVGHTSREPEIIKQEIRSSAKDNEIPKASLKGSNSKDPEYMSDEKMNKLAAKIVKAEIMGDMKLVNDLKTKLEQARQYRKDNPKAGISLQDDGVMLTSLDKMGNARPLNKPLAGDPNSKGGKRRTDTHGSGERLKYFSNDDKYNLSQMFEQEKYGNNYNDEEEFAKIASKHKNPNDDLSDIFTEEISKSRNPAKDSSREKQKAIRQHVEMEKTLEGCEYCLDSKNMLKHLMVSCGSKSYVSLPSRKSLVSGHCFISSFHHVSCATAVDEDVWEEIMDYRKCLTKYFNSLDQDVVFFETATRLHKYPHMVIQCVPMPRDVGDMAAIYFKKAILECETEWAVNKKVVDLKGRNIRKGVPKGLPYFWVDFGMDPGFAHVIEDQHVFPKTFAEEIIAGMLDLDHSLWKNPPREHTDQQRKKVLDFIGMWKPFDTVSKR